MEKITDEKKEVKLMAYHYRAVELRYQGHTFPEVTRTLTEEYQKDFKDTRVRNWFTSRGILFRLYLDYARQESERRRQLVLEEMKKLLPKLPQKLQELLDRTAYNPFSGKTVFDENGKPIPKVDTITVATIKLMVEMLGFRVDPHDVPGDPLDDYFNRAEKEIEKQNDDF